MICPTPISIRDSKSLDGGSLSVPCGRCAICLQNRRNDWIIRLREEQKNHNSSIFLTLTYSDENLYRNDCGWPSVNKEHVQLFLKRLRRKLTKKIRYYCVGEYGGKTGRPHYHLILFNMTRDDEKYIIDSWHYGSIHLGTVTIASISYVAKYHISKTQYPANSDPPFVTMSRRPGIGASYVEKMKNYHNVHNSYYTEFQQKKRLPRYYKEKLYTKAERKKIASVFNDDTYSIETINEFKRKNPNDNYFLYKLYQIKEAERKFKEKSSLNQKL